MSRSHHFLGRALPLAACLLSACETSSGAVRIPAPEIATFELDVYPVLLRDCGFPACHGSTARFFRVFGPGRTRLTSDTATFAPATTDELTQSYERARSMLAHERSVLDSPLLRKPLSIAAGGAEHGGENRWGENVYSSLESPGYAEIRVWALSREADAVAETSDDAGPP